jgi:uncharacterized protein
MDRRTVEDNLIFLGIVGSKAYGTDLEYSDVDLKGVMIAPIKYHLGTYSFEQKDQWDVNETGRIGALDLSKDKVVYELKKFMNLITSQNPNILDLLWLPEDKVLFTTPTFESIILMRDFLLSQDCYKSFGGYAASQIKRMENHRIWLQLENEGKVITQPKPEDYLPEDMSGMNLLPTSELYAFYEFLVIMLKDKLQYFDEYEEIQESFKKVDWKGFIKQHGLSDEVDNFVQRATNCSDNYIRLLHATQEYNSALRRYFSWKDWKLNRNPERAALERKCGYDSKNAMHCIRLQRMLVEILQKEEIYVSRTEDADYLKEIRRGEISYEDLLAESARLKAASTEALKTTKLPKKLDKNFTSGILEDILSRQFKCTIGRGW